MASTLLTCSGFKGQAPIMHACMLPLLTHSNSYLLHHPTVLLPMANPASEDRLFALGDDIASLILLRLPVDDLCRFLCVSKRWYRTISSPSFNIRHHRDHPSSCISCGFLYHLVDPAQSSTRALDISQLEAIPCRHHEYEHSLPSLLLDRLRSMTLDASQQHLLLADTHIGVVLFLDKNVQPEHYLLWNPLTQQQVTLPRPPPSNFPYRIAKLSIVDGSRFLVVALHWKRTAPSVEIRAFYSDTGEWTTTSLSAGVLFPTGVSSPTLIGETLYWVDDDGEVSAFESREGRFFKLPLPDKVTADCKLYNGRLFPSAGKLYYVYFDQLWKVTVWEYKSRTGQNTAGNEAPWLTRHLSNLADMVASHQHVFHAYQEIMNLQTGIPGHDRFLPLALHHAKAQIVYFKFEGFILRLDLEEKNLEVVREIENELPQFHTAFACVIPYEQPISPIKIPDVN